MMDCTKLTWSDFDAAVTDLSTLICSHVPNWKEYSIYGQPRGGLVLSIALSHALNLPHGIWSNDSRQVEISGSKILWTDDVIETGVSLFNAVSTAKDLQCEFFPICWVLKPYAHPWFAAPEQDFLYLRLADIEEWIVFPWENQTPEAIGEDCRAYAVGIGGLR